VQRIPRVIRYADYPVAPWRNGLGLTREVIAAGAGNGGGDGVRDGGFDWRVSMAQITSEAPFSFYPGIRRTLAVVDGGALELVVEGQKQRIGVGDAAVTFAGDATVSARPLDAQVTDLNLMADEEHWAGSIVPLRDREYAGGSHRTVIVSIHASLRVRTAEPTGGPQTYTLGRLDSLVLDETARTLEFDPGESTSGQPFAFVVRVDRKG
jgi:environmental stress-induced protein Ves